jgi:hypothetical protein
MRRKDRRLFQGGLMMHTNAVRYAFAGLALAAVLAVSSMASAETITFNAALSGANEVPPVETGGQGKAVVTYDTATKQLTWTINFTGLTGDATVAHFHGPAGPKENAKVAVMIGKAPKSPATGSATLTDEQAADLLAGRWYINIHTDKNRPGEIRGQVVKGK